MTVFCSFLNVFGNTNKNYLTLNLFGAATMTTKENTKTQNNTNMLLNKL